jgi:glutamine synthetase
MPASPSQLGALRDEWRSRGLHSVLAQFTDIHGVAKGKLVPLEHLQSLVDVGAGFSGPSIWGTGLPRHGARSEYCGRVIPESGRLLPWMSGIVHMVCDGYAGGEPLASCSRQTLKRVLRALEARGWTLHVGIEPEFFLLKRDAQGRYTIADADDTLHKPSYDLKAIGRNLGFIDELRRTLEALGFELTQIDHEDANGQYELNYRYGAALEAADRYMLFKMAAHAVAERHGLIFSCMPKPFANAPGSGLHFHLSITDAQGKAVFADAADAMGLSREGYRFIAGLLHHADALAALCAPTVNSYKRLAAGESLSGTTWAPVWKSYGANNRTTLVRTVDGRLEWRLPDPACNVYAAIAAVCAAGMAGIGGAYEAPVPCNVDLYELDDATRQSLGAQRLPSNLGEALAALRGDEPLRAAVGHDFCDEFLRVKTLEWNAFQHQVSDWELRRYADYF